MLVYTSHNITLLFCACHHTCSTVLFLLQEPYVSPAAVLKTTGIRGIGRTLRLLAVGISDELRRLLGHVGLQLPPVYLRLVAPITDPKALALLPLQVCCLPGGMCACKVFLYKHTVSAKNQRSYCISMSCPWVWAVCVLQAVLQRCMQVCMLYAVGCWH
jgi:hypothetical protein